jgi:penicillin-binding protein 1A
MDRPFGEGTVRPRPRRVRRAVRHASVAALALVILAVGAVGVLWPLTPSVASAPGLVAARLAAAHDPLMSRLPQPNRVGQALVATEDSRFYSEPGIDPFGLARALLHPIRGGPDPGGATIDMQLAKMLYTPGDSSRSAILEQMEIALKLEAHFSKSDILRMYESAAYFGNGFYGLPAAARGYFGLSPSALDWAQASMLAGLVQAPSAYDPLVHFALARQRQHEVLGRLVATGVLSSRQASGVFADPLHLR